MVLSFSSPAAVRFLAAVGQGHGLKGSTRMAGIDKEAGNRFLRDRYLELRRGGLSAVDAVQALGFCSSRVPDWEAMVGRGDRHHLRVDASREQICCVDHPNPPHLHRASSQAGLTYIRPPNQVAASEAGQSTHDEGPAIGRRGCDSTVPIGSSSAVRGRTA